MTAEASSRWAARKAGPISVEKTLAWKAKGRELAISMASSRVSQYGGADQNCATLVRFQGAVANLYEPERRLQPGLERGGVIGRDLLDQRPVISLNDLNRVGR